MKIVFMGTPDFAAAALNALIAAGHEITAVVTQPDRPKGRSGKPEPSPVKKCAQNHNIAVLQPRRIKNPKAMEELKRYPADVFIVAAFGQILSREILDMPPYGCLNIHASLLPKYRGASPIQHAILDGGEKTGITVMQMDDGIDTGDMLYKKELAIGPEDTFETLHDRLAALGGEAITEALELLREGKLMPEKQRDELSCYAPLMDKSMGRIDFTQGAEAVDRKIRAMTPWPGTFTAYRGKQLKIWLARPVFGEIPRAGVPGEILETDRDSILVATGQGAIRVYELQLEGKKRMNARDFLLGVRMQPGEILGGE